jgi:hypothetical protein
VDAEIATGETVIMLPEEVRTEDDFRRLCRAVDHHVLPTRFLSKVLSYCKCDVLRRPSKGLLELAWFDADDMFVAYGVFDVPPPGSGYGKRARIEFGKNDFPIVYDDPLYYGLSWLGVRQFAWTERPDGTLKED